jgi:hypothetical protein
MPATAFPTFTPVIGQPFFDKRGGKTPHTVRVQSGTTGGIIEFKRFETVEDAQMFSETGIETQRYERNTRTDYQSGYS